jgi:hypothetical protein
LERQLDKGKSLRLDDSMDEPKPGKKKPTPEQDAAVRRHLRYQNDQRLQDEADNKGVFSSITKTGAGVILRIGLMVMRAGGRMISRGSGHTGVYWGYPFGMITIVAGALISCVGFLFWAVAALCQAIYRGIAG